MWKMFVSTRDDGEDIGRFKKFKRNIGKFQDFTKNRQQPNSEADYLGKPCIYCLNVFGIEKKMRIPQLRLLQTILTFRSSDQQDSSARVSISLSRKNLVGESMRLKMKCNEEEGEVASQKLEFSSNIWGYLGRFASKFQNF